MSAGRSAKPDAAEAPAGVTETALESGAMSDDASMPRVSPTINNRRVDVDSNTATVDMDGAVSAPDSRSPGPSDGTILIEATRSGSSPFVDGSSTLADHSASPHSRLAATIDENGRSVVSNDSTIAFEGEPPRAAADATIAAGSLLKGATRVITAEQLADPNQTVTIEASLAQADMRDPGAPEYVSRFQILRTLGQGAFGCVYLARDPQLDREVAIKVAKAGRMNRRSDIDRFLREARAAAQLRHPHIVPIYEMGLHEGSTYLAYQFIRGRTLRDLIAENGKLPPETAVRFARSIAEGLDYAHRLNIIHRDMKPDNVLVDERGEPHITDFGLAKRLDEDVTQTREGAFLGTPCYMSPEQASGGAHAADGRTDIWSVGVMLDEMLTGVRPFEGSVAEVLVSIQQREPARIRQLDATLPRDLETIVQKCLTKSTDGRYQTGRELADELTRWLNGEPILARPVGPVDRAIRWSKRNPLPASLIATVALVLVVASIVSGAFAYLARQRLNLLEAASRDRLRSQIAGLESADAEQLSALVERLRPEREQILASLLYETEPADSRDEHRLDRMRTVFASLFPDEATRLAWFTAIPESLLDCPPNELAARLELLSGHGAPFVDSLWTVAKERRRLLPAAAALANFDPQGRDWPSVAADVVASLSAEDPLTLTQWLPMFTSVRETLFPEMDLRFRSSDSPRDRQMAANMLAFLHSDQPDRLIEQAAVAEPEQLAACVAALRRSTVSASEKSQKIAAKVRTWDASSDAAARQRALANLAALALGIADPNRGDNADPAWSVFEAKRDPTIRNMAIARLASANVSVQTIESQLDLTRPARVVAAAVIALGDYGTAQILPHEQDRLATRLEALFRQHPSAEVHSACEWLLKRWGRATDVEAWRISLQSPAPQPGMNWHEDPLGITFVVFRGPIEFDMGSPQNEAGRVFQEHFHRRRIPRSFGVATREVTCAEFQKVFPEHPYRKDVAPTDDCPVNDTSWFNAAQYCRKLSELAGLSEDQMVFPAVDQLTRDNRQTGDAWDRAGYRLPTAAEWEYAARAESTSPWFAGADSALWPRYGWFNRNSLDRTHPAGLLRPNGNGLFDMTGNLTEWCQSWFFEDYPPPAADGAVVDAPVIRNGAMRELRGGWYAGAVLRHRSAERDAQDPEVTTDFAGFRLARTYFPTPP